MRIDLPNHENILSDESINVGFGARKVFKKLPVGQAQECRTFRKNVKFFFNKTG